MIPFFVIHFFIFLFLINTILAEQQPKCEAFDCKIPGKVYSPYSYTEECGVLPINCTAETPTLIDLKGRRTYRVKNLLEDGTFVIYDSVLRQLLDTKACYAIRNITLPTSPLLSFESIKNSSLTFLKCHEKDRINEDIIIPAHVETYEDCLDDHVLYYSYPEQLNPFQFLDNHSISLCTIVSLPLIDNPPPALKDNNPFSLCTAEFYWKWKWTAECPKCSRVGRHCLPDEISGPFKCVHVNAPDSKRRNKILIGIGAGIGGVLLALGILAFFLIRRRRRNNDLHKNSALISRSISPDLSMQADPEKGSSYFNTPIFTYKELEEATNNFDSSRELGDGGFGTVYYGVLKDGRAVAVKRLYENNGKRVEQFMNEVGILSLLRHTNLVSLYGCTSRHSRELLLVYEYVSNGTVADHLHGEHSSARLVTWPIRMSIAIESAGALVYLHASDIVHRDVKTNNILLDKNFHVKVADFGLSRLFPTAVTHVSTAPQGTPGYVDPEYHQCYQLTSKSDVYSFGVVLIELISSKPAVDINRHRHEINLSNMAVNKIHNDALHELVDISLGYDTNATTRRTMTLVAELAFRCLQQDSDARPTMVEVLEVLKEIEVERTKVVKPGEMDIPAKDVRLLNNNPPVSPNSVTDKWVSMSSTPNTSS